MAQGNIGNLLQHFVALNCAERLLGAWGKYDQEVVYVDCFSMAPWEPVQGGQPQGFVGRVDTFARDTAAGDLTATTFLKAWERRYHPNPIPDHPQRRDYPNTAVLLRTAFPRQAWEMRLHDIDEDKQADLVQWANSEREDGFRGSIKVAGRHQNSPLISRCPVTPDRAVFVMLDPDQIVPKARSDRDFDTEQLYQIFGGYRLDILSRPKESDAAPALITLFSYSDRWGDDTDEIVTRRFEPEGWIIERVKSGPWNNRGDETYHLGWAVSCGLPPQVPGRSLQIAWDEWSR